MSEDGLENRWLVLASFSLHAFCNQFLYQNFASVADVAEDTFHVDDEGVNLLYTAALVSAVPSFICVMACSFAYNWIVSLACTAATVLAAWLRYFATVQGNYKLAILSSVALGPGTGMIFTGFAELPVLLFPGGRQRHVATGVVVQSTFFGWASGCLVAAAWVNSSADMSSFCLVQAIAVLLCLPVFLLWYRDPRDASLDTADLRHGLLESAESQCSETYGAVAGSHVEEGAGDGDTSAGPAGQPRIMQLSMRDSVWSMLQNGSFLMQALACALLQAVAFTVPAVLDEILSRMGYSHIECAINAFVFIMAGVVLGMGLSYVPASRDQTPDAAYPLILALFLIVTSALLVLQLCVGPLSSRVEQMGPLGEQSIYFVLIVITGACSLGSVNVTLPSVCAEAHPVPETYSGGAIELLSFAMGSVVLQLSTGLQFLICVGTALAATILMSVGVYLRQAVQTIPVATDSTALIGQASLGDDEMDM